MPQAPKPLVGSNKAARIAAQVFVGVARRPVDDLLQDPEECFRHLEIPLVASLVERDQDVVGEAPVVASAR
jgi:hypothetical protein